MVGIEVGLWHLLGLVLSRPSMFHSSSAQELPNLNLCISGSRVVRQKTKNDTPRSYNGQNKQTKNVVGWTFWTTFITEKRFYFHFLYLDLVYPWVSIIIKTYIVRCRCFFFFYVGTPVGSRTTLNENIRHVFDIHTRLKMALIFPNRVVCNFQRLSR